MDIDYDRVNVLGIPCDKGESVRVAFDEELNFLTGSRYAAYIIDVRFDADGQVTVRQAKESYASGLWLAANGAGRKGLPVRIHAEEPICVSKVLGIRSGRIYTNKGCAYLLLTADRLADFSTQYSLQWRSPDAFGTVETLDMERLSAPTEGVVDFNQRRLKGGRR